MNKLTARFSIEDLDTVRKWEKEACWVVRLGILRSKIHHWAWKYGGRRWHDRVVDSWWYRLWGKWGYYDESRSPLANMLLHELTVEIDKAILEEIDEMIRNDLLTDDNGTPSTDG